VLFKNGADLQPCWEPFGLSNGRGWTRVGASVLSGFEVLTGRST
jgi:hypothetical protein